MIRIYSGKISENGESKPGENQSDAAKQLLLNALPRDFGIVGEPDFVFGPQGKPYLTAPGGEPLPIWFNLSHSGEWAVCAVSDEGEIGVDIQKITPARLKVARRIFTAEQCAALEAVTGAARDELFCELWVLHESSAKLRGGRVFDTVDCDGAKLIDAPAGYKAAVAVEMS